MCPSRHSIWKRKCSLLAPFKLLLMRVYATCRPPVDVARHFFFLLLFQFFLFFCPLLSHSIRYINFSILVFDSQTVRCPQTNNEKRKILFIVQFLSLFSHFFPPIVTREEIRAFAKIKKIKNMKFFVFFRFLLLDVWTANKRLTGKWKNDDRIKGDYVLFRRRFWLRCCCLFTNVRRK